MVINTTTKITTYSDMITFLLNVKVCNYVDTRISRAFAAFISIYPVKEAACASVVLLAIYQNTKPHIPGPC
jgi:hypothetical protein